MALFLASSAKHYMSRFRQGQVFIYIIDALTTILQKNACKLVKKVHLHALWSMSDPSYLNTTPTFVLANFPSLQIIFASLSNVKRFVTMLSPYREVFFFFFFFFF